MLGMPTAESRRRAVKHASSEVSLPDGLSVDPWTEKDFRAIQRLSAGEGWTSFTSRSDESLTAWRNSWPALVVHDEQNVLGFIRCLTDTEITAYIAEILVAPEFRNRGIGDALIAICHHLYPHVRFDLLCTEDVDGFYESIGCRKYKGYRKSYI